MNQAPSYYEIDLKQGDLLIQLISDDADFISSQMARWFTLLVDESKVPVAIRPGLPTMSKPVPEPMAEPMVAPTPAAVAPIVQPSETQLLLEQIQLLQSQVQSLTLQVAHTAPVEAVAAPSPVPPPEPVPPAVPVAEALVMPLPEPAPVASPPEPAPQPMAAAPVMPPPEPAPAMAPPVLEAPPAQASIFDAPAVATPQPVLEVPAPAAPLPAMPAVAPSLPVESAERTLDLDALAVPAHQEVAPNFEALGRVESFPAPPVNNSPLPVDNLPPAEPAPVGEAQAPLDLMDIPVAGVTPVENPPVAEATDDFDALLSSILTEPAPVVAAPEPEQTAALSEPETSLPSTGSGMAGALFDEPTFESALESALAEEAHETTPAVDLSGLQALPPTPTPEVPAVASGMAGALLDEPSFESALESALAEPEPSQPALDLGSLQSLAPSAAPAVVSGVAGALFDEPGESSFDAALESALGEASGSAPALDLAALSQLQPEPVAPASTGVAGALFDEPQSPMGNTLVDMGLPPEPQGPVFTPPRVDYDFGIPMTEMPVDPSVRQLNLDSLQVSPPEGAPFDSPFPQVDTEGDAPTAPVHEAFALEPTENLHSLQVETFQDLCDLAPQAASGMDFLILSAYFLSKVQQAEKYALKDLNAHLMRAGLTPVNHSVLEQVMAQGHLQLVPDLTGTASTAEYRLTEMGESRAAEMIQS